MRYILIGVKLNRNSPVRGDGPVNVSRRKCRLANPLTLTPQSDALDLYIEVGMVLDLNCVIALVSVARRDRDARRRVP